MVSQPVSYGAPDFSIAYHIDDIMDPAGWKRGQPASFTHLE